jgi:hypothetical protein
MALAAIRLDEAISGLRGARPDARVGAGGRLAAAFAATL